jgi:hypothetical protein
MDKFINRRVPSNPQQTTQFVASPPVNYPIRNPNFKPETAPGLILAYQEPLLRVFPNTEPVEKMPSRSDFNPGILPNDPGFHNTPNNPPYWDFLSPNLSEIMDPLNYNNDTLTSSYLETSPGKLPSILRVSPFSYAFTELAFYVPVKR